MMMNVTVTGDRGQLGETRSGSIGLFMNLHIQDASNMCMSIIAY